MLCNLLVRSSKEYNKYYYYHYSQALAQKKSVFQVNPAPSIWLSWQLIGSFLVSGKPSEYTVITENLQLDAVTYDYTLVGVFIVMLRNKSVNLY